MARSLAGCMGKFKYSPEGTALITQTLQKYAKNCYLWVACSWE